MVTDPHPDEPDEAALIRRARTGDEAAYGVLFHRHHSAALTYARGIAGPNDAEDLVAEAFAKLLSALQRDLGPTESFRPYLFTTIRRLWANTLRSRSRVDVVDDIATTAERRGATQPPDDQAWSEEAIANAFRRLPERWREALWLANVDGYSQAEIADHLNIKANAVAALLFRSREGLRREFLAQHLATTSDRLCQSTLESLPSYVRETLPAKKTDEVAGHLEGCATCTAALTNLRAINENLGIVLPALAVAGFLDGRHVSATTSVPVTPAAASAVSAPVKVFAGGVVAAVIVSATIALWPAGTDDGPTPSAPAPTPEIQVIDLGVIPRTPPPRAPQPTAVHTNVPTAPKPTLSRQPSPSTTPSATSGGQGTSVTGVTGGQTPATVSASTSP